MNNGPATSQSLKLLQNVMCSVAILSLLGTLSRWHQLLDLCSHFRVQYFTLLAMLAVLLWRWKSPRWAAVALLACLHNAALIAPFYFGAGSTSEPSQRLSLISFNVQVSNQHSRDVLKYLQHKQPDVVLLMEVNNRWIREVSALNDDYPHRVIAAADGPVGIAMYSKVPIRRHELLGLGTEFYPSIWAELDVAGRSVGFLGTHPPPPVTPQLYRIRNEQLALVAEKVRSSGMPTIVAGDLNATPWCFGYQQLIAAGLSDSARGFGLQVTWNSHLPPLWIPIDHVLTTKEFTTLRRRVGPSCGSDHYAVEAELGLASSVPTDLTALAGNWRNGLMLFVHKNHFGGSHDQILFRAVRCDCLRRGGACRAARRRHRHQRRNDV